MGTLYVVATPIGNLSDITLRAIETLKNVDLILCEDTRHSLILLNHLGIKKRLMAYHKFNEKEKTSEIENLLKEGSNIALITDAGTPCISDPGYILIEKLKNDGIFPVAVGGISAVISALSVSGLDTNSFAFFGFFPRENKEKEILIKKIKEKIVNLICIYESPKRIINTLEYLNKALGNIKVSISRDLTKIHESNYYGYLEDVINTLKENKEASLGEYTIILEAKSLEKEEENKELEKEALLVDIMIKEDKTLKEAIEILNKKSDYSKKEIYDASLNLKKLF